MAAVSLSPSPVPISSVMSSRRVPLSSNPNAANSPLRGAAALAAAHAAKQRRSHADMQREEAYGQPPPAKRQMLDLAGGHKASSSKPVTQRSTARGYPADKPAARSAAPKMSEQEVDNLRQWQTQLRARLPKMVFYFESVPDDQRARLTKQVTYLGAREEKFFSINITHVVTTRAIPPEKAAGQQDGDTDSNAENQPHSEQQPKTIDPSLLDRSTDRSLSAASAKRKLLFETSGNRRLPTQVQDDSARRPKGRNTDVLYRAREMGKKIWSLEKLQKIVELLLEPDPYKVAVLAYGPRGTGEGQDSTSTRSAEGSRLLQLALQNERVHGPSDRDQTVATKELIYFKGPYLYVYDIEEKLKPIMVREYAKVADKKDGDWPQFRTAANGRCPFVEDCDLVEKKQEKREKERISKAAVVPAAPALNPPQPQVSRPVTGKRTLSEMEDGQNRRSAAPARLAEVFDSAKVTNPPTIDFRPQNAFTSKARAGRLFAGEPVASGVQPSNITSAVRSQMISSTTGGLGAKAGTSKEIHRLQRKVLQRNSIPLTSQGSSRIGGGGVPEGGYESMSHARSTSIGRAASHKLEVVEEDERRANATAKLRRTASVPPSVAPQQKKPRKRDPKPGYCENCQDKFDDFDEHIMSGKHRRFAENDNNWTELDELLVQLRRIPRRHDADRVDYSSDNCADEWAS